MKGLEMMFKALGLDPEQMKQAIERAINEARATMNHFNKRFDDMGLRFDKIDARLDRLENLIKEEYGADVFERMNSNGKGIVQHDG